MNGIPACFWLLLLHTCSSQWVSFVASRLSLCVFAWHKVLRWKTLLCKIPTEFDWNDAGRKVCEDLTLVYLFIFFRLCLLLVLLLLTFLDSRFLLLSLRFGFCLLLGKDHNRLQVLIVSTYLSSWFLISFFSVPFILSRLRIIYLFIYFFWVVNYLVSVILYLLTIFPTFYVPWAEQQVLYKSLVLSCRFVHSFICSLICCFLRLFVFSFVPSVVRSFVFLFLRSFVRMCAHLFSFVRSFVCSIVRSFLPSFLRSNEMKGTRKQKTQFSAQKRQQKKWNKII